MKLTVLHNNEPLTKREVAKQLNSTPEKVSRRIAKMKRRNPKLETVTIQRLIQLTKRHSAGH